jgi:DNA-binding Lrp family transcriptional regulator
MKSSKKIKTIGYYDINEIKEGLSMSYEVDSGKYIFLDRYKKYILNKNRDLKTFKTLEKAENYIHIKLKKHKEIKEKKISKLPKSLYLVLIKEESSSKTFVKVGITSKRFIMRRFSKIYGYDGYVLESILRRIDTPDAEKLESEIKDKLNKKRSVKKYRPLLESFSGYSECFNILGLEDIIKIFDGCVNKQT